MGAISIRNKTRRKRPRLPFALVAQAILPGWEISLAFVDSIEARRLNETLRKKNYVPNVLSYTVGRRSGEIIVCLAEAKKQAPSYHLPPTTYYLFLFIHGLLHLKGHPHGATMERRERALLKKWGASEHTNVTTHRNRHRHRHLPSKTGGGRRAL